MKSSTRASDMAACSFSNWYPHFKKITVESVWLPLPEEVVQYCSSGGTIVSTEAAHTQSQSDDDDDVDWETSEYDAPALQRPEFASFAAAVRAALSSLEAGAGGAFIKLNWSAPVDVRWLTLGRALRSGSADDVLLLLRSSARLQRDLCRLQECGDGVEVEVAPELVLRRWVDISPAAEFRCFVRHGRLLAVCQREVSQFVPHLARDGADIVTDVSSLFTEHIQLRFPLLHYVFDVFRSTKDQAWLLDFSPLAPPTDPALFTWEQLHGLQCINCGEPVDTSAALCAACVDCGVRLPVFQHVAGADRVQRPPYADAELPYDVTQMATGGDAAAIVSLLRKSQLSRPEPSSGEETDG